LANYKLITTIIATKPLSLFLSVRIIEKNISTIKIKKKIKMQLPDELPQHFTAPVPRLSHTPLKMTAQIFKFLSNQYMLFYFINTPFLDQEITYAQ